MVNFFHGFRIFNENICFLYSSEGFFAGEAHIKMTTEQDWKEAFQLSMSEFTPGRFVEILDSNEQDWKRAYNSQFPNNETSVNKNDGNQMCIERGILRVNNLPYTFIETDISGIFSGFKLKQDGIKRSIISGKPSGEAFVLFETKEEADKA